MVRVQAGALVKKALLIIAVLFFFGIGLTVLTMVFASTAFVATYILIVQPNQIKGSSMEPTYPSDAYLLTEKVSYRSNDPARGDIIIFHHPVKENFNYIERIIGVGGDEIAIH
ncbi:MAG: signal peptidase I, partial [Candidatus Roizmanbacteria bacterium]|nr:signal peptidase I [Candidatus Roizmanbacteria bacterium]